ncbi:hypothetical protein [Sinorhizobium medicae]|uniref:hypothetical protein n=1 Tax=Sinorhizobium medicae TaxID=110321 RepID=UPI000FD7F133|nr:hypothetical protein [Sinorhizobium medicae]RVJ38497.1 hypothetical protein CN180_22185 [Sinorhizobium medicae]
MMMRSASLEAQSAVAYSVRGYSMGAIRDGWWAFTNGLKGKPNDDLIDELCIARIKSARTLLRFLRKGRKPRTWDLVSVNGDPLLDQELEWAERVVWLEPHRVTHTEIDALDRLGTAE